MTDSSLCTFDLSTKGDCVDAEGNPTGDVCDVDTGDPMCPEGSTCIDSRQFRLVYTPDNQNWIGFKQNASNPGQFFYNLIYDGEFPATVSVSIPYPFVTHGGMPVHVYDGFQVASNHCFVPQEEALQSINTQFSIEDYIQGGTNTDGVTCDMVCGPNGAGYCTFDVEVLAPSSGSGQVYVNVHLDYGLKGTHVDANPCDDGLFDRYDRGIAPSPWESFDAYVNTTDDALVDLGIPDLNDYLFFHTDGELLHQDVVQNLNSFKMIAGVFGIVSQSFTSSGVSDIPVELVSVKTGEIVQTGVTDEDGYFLLTHRHRGKPAPYLVYLGAGYNMVQEIGMKNNGWGEVNFDLDTGTSTAAFGPTGEGD